MLIEICFQYWFAPVNERRGDNMGQPLVLEVFSDYI